MRTKFAFEQFCKVIKTLSVRFVDGTLDGVSGDLAFKIPLEYYRTMPSDWKIVLMG